MPLTAAPKHPCSAPDHLPVPARRQVIWRTRSFCRLIFLLCTRPVWPVPLFSFQPLCHLLWEVLLDYVGFGPICQIYVCNTLWFFLIEFEPTLTDIFIWVIVWQMPVPLSDLIIIFMSSSLFYSPFYPQGQHRAQSEITILYILLVVWTDKDLRSPDIQQNPVEELAKTTEALQSFIALEKGPWTRYDNFLKKQLHFEGVTKLLNSLDTIAICCIMRSDRLFSASAFTSTFLLVVKEGLCLFISPQGGRFQ